MTKIKEQKDRSFLNFPHFIKDFCITYSIKKARLPTYLKSWIYCVPIIFIINSIHYTTKPLKHLY